MRNQIGLWIRFPRSAVTPLFNKRRRDARHRPAILGAGSEIPSPDPTAIRGGPLRRCANSGDKLKDVLPGTCCIWHTQTQRLTVAERADCVRDKSVRCPVAAADDIAAANCCQPKVPAGGAEMPVIGLSNDLGSGFAGAIGFMSAQTI